MVGFVHLFAVFVIMSLVLWGARAFVKSMRDTSGEHGHTKEISEGERAGVLLPYTHTQSIMPVILVFVLLFLGTVLLFPWALARRAGYVAEWLGGGALFALVLIVSWFFAIGHGLLPWSGQGKKD
ncbi:MAG TPA: hypothetical protein DCE42_02930 [Myxococcales bacterium]|nr:hypothetical protein [Deltaproteobacteria bacterium]HAA53680.1 hypothetical protein [Myxococcales bacterium]|tara:strand:- start:352 stop:726 length:375 start_codon:yes stop_codon:yes gene_type:complete